MASSSGSSSPPPNGLLSRMQAVADAPRVGVLRSAERMELWRNRVMRFRLTIVVASLLTVFTPLAWSAEESNRSVVYAGAVDCPRAKNFVAFLKKHFVEVTPVELGKFQDENAKGHDVVIFDWTSIYPR